MVDELSLENFSDETQRFLETLANAEHAVAYRKMLITTPDGTSESTNVDKYYLDSIPVGYTFHFTATESLSLSHRALQHKPIQSKEVKGKRLKKGTVVEKPFYQSKGHGKRF